MEFHLLSSYATTPEHAVGLELSNIGAFKEAFAA